MYYKVITKRDNKLLSYNSRAQGTVQYVVNQWTVPLEGYGPLMVFSSLNSALLLMDTDHEIWECEIEKAETQPTHIVSVHSSQSQKDWWKEYKKETSTYCQVQSPPKNTVFADKVKITRKIKSKG